MDSTIRIVSLSLLLIPGFFLTEFGIGFSHHVQLSSKRDSNEVLVSRRRDVSARQASRTGLVWEGLCWTGKVAEKELATFPPNRPNTRRRAARASPKMPTERR